MPRLKGLDAKGQRRLGFPQEGLCDLPPTGPLRQRIHQRAWRLKSRTGAGVGKGTENREERQASHGPILALLCMSKLGGGKPRPSPPPKTGPCPLLLGSDARDAEGEEGIVTKPYHIPQQ